MAVDGITSITIRNLNGALKRNLRIRAAEHGRSMEEEARDIIRQAVGQPVAPKNLGQSIHQRFAALGGVDLAQASRSPMRPSPEFE